MSYISLTAADRELMLAAIGVESVEELFASIPQGVRFRGELDVPPALAEADLAAHLGELAARNVLDELSFLGAGIYDHYVPAVVDAVLARGEFLTAYTPYQPELSQGILQAIFEYQTAICELTGMDVSNASGYDVDLGGRRRLLPRQERDGAVADRDHGGHQPAGAGGGQDLRARVPARGGRGAPQRRDDRPRGGRGARRRCAAAVIFQQPNFFGCFEPAPRARRGRERRRRAPVAHVDLISLGLLEAPGNYGCALAIGEGQSAGTFMSYGGPHFGFLAAKEPYLRRLPGRIVGETVDVNGERGFVLTLQTREQHIRREKATSNITTNQTLLALAGLVQLSLLGPAGLRETAETCMALTQYARERLAAVGLEPLFPDKPVFKEFALDTGRRDAAEVVSAARALGVNPGYPLGADYPSLAGGLLVALTERRTRGEIDRLVEVLAP